MTNAQRTAFFKNFPVSGDAKRSAPRLTCPNACVREASTVHAPLCQVLIDWIGWMNWMTFRVRLSRIQIAQPISSTR